MENKTHRVKWVIAWAVLVAASAGFWLLRKLDLPDLSELETMVFAGALGLGQMAYLALGLGLSGLLYPAVIDAVMGGAYIVKCAAMPSAQPT